MVTIVSVKGTVFVEHFLEHAQETEEHVRQQQHGVGVWEMVHETVRERETSRQ